MNPIFKLSARGNIKEIEEYLASLDESDIKSVLDSKDGLGYSALATAVALGHVEVVKLYLKYKADPNSQDYNGKTPLHYTGEENFLEIAKLLIDAGANIHLKDSHDNQPLWTAVFYVRGHEEKLPLVELLLQHGADSKNKNKSNNSPLDFAEKVGYKKLIELLEKFKK